MKGIDGLLAEGRKDEAFIAAADYVKGLSHKFGVTGFDKEDLENEALIELWEAIENFDGGRGIKFKTYVGRCIVNRIMKMIKRTQRQKRVRNDEEMMQHYPSYYNSTIETKIDLETFIPQQLDLKLREIWMTFLGCGSLTEAGLELGYAFNEAVYLRRKIIRKIAQFYR